jgi:hypothetical protein
MFRFLRGGPVKSSSSITQLASSVEFGQWMCKSPSTRRRVGLEAMSDGRPWIWFSRELDIEEVREMSDEVAEGDLLEAVGVGARFISAAATNTDAGAVAGARRFLGGRAMLRIPKASSARF